MTAESQPDESRRTLTEGQQGHQSCMAGIVRKICVELQC